MKTNTHLAPFRLTPDSPEIIWVEVENTAPSDEGLEIPVAMSVRTPALPSVSFEGALKQIKPAARAIMEALTDLNNPESVEVEFGVKLNAKAGAFFTSLDGEANFKITLTWKNAKAAPSSAAATPPPEPAVERLSHEPA